MLSLKYHQTTLLLLGFFILTLLPTITFADDDDEAMSNTLATVTIAQKIQTSSGLKTVKLTTTQYQPEHLAYGQALSLLPLLELRSQYFARSAELALTQSEFQQAKKDLTRQRTLFRAKVVAGKTLQSQQAKTRALSAQVVAQQFQLNQSQASIQLTWGTTFTNWAIDSNSQHLDNWINNHVTLLRINLPVHYPVASSFNEIHIAKSTDRDQATLAQLISAAPDNGSTDQQAYFFKTDNPNIQANARIIAWLPLAKQALTGVIIPDSAIIRNLDQHYVYRQTNAESFTRQNVNDLIKIDQNYFIPQSLEAGDIIVVSGAQMLWSEEFRTRIPEEDDDDDDDDDD